MDSDVIIAINPLKLSLIEITVLFSKFILYIKYCRGNPEIKFLNYSIF